MPEATIDLPLSFSVPEMFRAIESPVSAEANTKKLIADLTSLDPQPTDDEIAHAIVSQQAMYEMLSAAGAVYAGILLCGPTEQEREKPLSSVLLSVTARPSELSEARSIARRARPAAARSCWSCMDAFSASPAATISNSVWSMSTPAGSSPSTAAVRSARSCSRRRDHTSATASRTRPGRPSYSVSAAVMSAPEVHKSPRSGYPGFGRGMAGGKDVPDRV